ncbi:hypothetical protein TNCV_1814851 [Trichonephila clavipes]|nr:hypothetical protein TNCV_1814851 [Trichonephila clavipes]
MWKNLEEYENIRRTLRPKFYNSFARECKASGSSDTYFRNFRAYAWVEVIGVGENISIERYLLSGKSKRQPCSCKGPSHYAQWIVKRQCRKLIFLKGRRSQSKYAHESLAGERIKTRERIILRRNKVVEALIDSGSSVFHSFGKMWQANHRGICGEARKTFQY